MSVGVLGLAWLMLSKKPRYQEFDDINHARLVRVKIWLHSLLTDRRVYLCFNGRALGGPRMTGHLSFFFFFFLHTCLPLLANCTFVHVAVGNTNANTKKRMGV